MFFSKYNLNKVNASSTHIHESDGGIIITPHVINIHLISIVLSRSFKNPNRSHLWCERLFALAYVAKPTKTNQMNEKNLNRARKGKKLSTREQREVVACTHNERKRRNNDGLHMRNEVSSVDISVFVAATL